MNEEKEEYDEVYRSLGYLFRETRVFLYELGEVEKTGGWSGGG